MIAALSMLSPPGLSLGFELVVSAASASLLAGSFWRASFRCDFCRLACEPLSTEAFKCSGVAGFAGGSSSSDTAEGSNLRSISLSRRLIEPLPADPNNFAST